MARRVPLVDVVIYPSEPIDRALACAECADVGDATAVWFGDSQLTLRELYVVLGAAATRTRRVRLGPAVTNPITRHPSVTASAVMTLHELTQGRASLGISIGGSALRMIGRSPAHLAELEQAILAVRKLWDADRNGLSFQFDGEIPIYVGGSGPRLLELSGRVADGCLAVLGASQEQLDAAWRSIELGRREAGRESHPFDLVCFLPLAIADDPVEAHDAVKPYIARTLLGQLPGELPRDERAILERLRRGQFRREIDATGAARAIPNALLAEWAISGTAEDCRKQLEAAYSRGVRHVGLIPFGEERAKTISSLMGALRQQPPRTP